MSNKLLLPHNYKIIGWCILIPATVGSVLLIYDFDVLVIKARMFALLSEDFFEDSKSFTMIDHRNIFPTIVGFLFLVGAMLVSFSKEKREDEFISRLRQSSLLWAVFLNYILLLLALLFIHGVAFIDVMQYNMFTILIIFIIRFNYLLFRSSKEMPNEKYHQSAASY